MRLRYRRRRAWLRVNSPVRRDHWARSTWFTASRRYARRLGSQVRPSLRKRPRRVKSDPLRLALMRARNVAQGLPPECPF